MIRNRMRSATRLAIIASQIPILAFAVTRFGWWIAAPIAALFLIGAVLHAWNLMGGFAATPEGKGNPDVE